MRCLLPNNFTSLGIFYNASQGESKKAEVEAWIKNSYPNAWEELTSMGRTRTRNENGLFNINRHIAA